MLDWGWQVQANRLYARREGVGLFRPRPSRVFVAGCSALLADRGVTAGFWMPPLLQTPGRLPLPARDFLVRFALSVKQTPSLPWLALFQPIQDTIPHGSKLTVTPSRPLSISTLTVFQIARFAATGLCNDLSAATGRGGISWASAPEK